MAIEAVPDVPVSPPAPPPEVPVVDLDAGQTYGRDTVKLMRPFKYRGVTYREIPVRVPKGLDIAKHVNPRLGTADAMALMCDLAELSADVFDAMYAGDRNAVDAAVGKHMRGFPATSTTSSPT